MKRSIGQAIRQTETLRAGLQSRCQRWHHQRQDDERRDQQHRSSPRRCSRDVALRQAHEPRNERRAPADAEHDDRHLDLVVERQESRQPDHQGRNQDEGAQEEHHVQLRMRAQRPAHRLAGDAETLPQRSRDHEDQTEADDD